MRCRRQLQDLSLNLALRFDRSVLKIPENSEVWMFYPSPEGTLFETMRAFLGGDDLTQPAFASRVRVFCVPGRGGRTKGPLFELAINGLTARQGTTLWAESARIWRRFAGRTASDGRVWRRPSEGWPWRSASEPNSGAHSETGSGALTAGFPNMPPGCVSPPEPQDTIRLNDVVCETRLGDVLKSYAHRAA